MKQIDEHREGADRTATRAWDKAAGCYRYHLPDGTEVSDESGSVYGEGAIEDLKRTVNAPSTVKGTAEPILGPGWCTCGGGYDPDCPDHGGRPCYGLLPEWVTFPLDDFDAEDGTVDRCGALQWLRENEMAAWPDSFIRLAG